MMAKEKIKQAIEILREFNVDMWLTFVRESSVNPDPMLDLILGANCTWVSAFIITSKGDAIAIVGSLDAQNIRDHAPYEVLPYLSSIKEPLLNTLKHIKPKTIAINHSQNDVMADGLSHGMYIMLNEYLRDTPYIKRLKTSESIIAALRGRKSATEVKYIQGAIDETLSIFDVVSKSIRIGMTEKEVARIINDELINRNLEPGWDADHCPGVFTGPESAGAHAGPTDRKIIPGHIMNIDFGVRKNGYVSDLQRTWYFQHEGEHDAPEPVKKGFKTIRDAIQKAANALKPGVEGWTIDQVARQYILDHGYTEYPHGLGHQVGRQAHDGSALLCPRWDRYKQIPYFKVEAGQVYTLEPRLTVDGHGIATIEEIVLVTKNGCEFLSAPQKSLYLIPYPLNT